MPIDPIAHSLFFYDLLNLPVEDASPHETFDGLDGIFGILFHPFQRVFTHHKFRFKKGELLFLEGYTGRGQIIPFRIFQDFHLNSFNGGNGIGCS
jgi:hypothetical protein